MGRPSLRTGQAELPHPALQLVVISRLEEAGYVEVTKTYRGKVPRTLLRLSGAGRKAFEQYRRKLKQAL